MTPIRCTCQYKNILAERDEYKSIHVKCRGCKKVVNVSGERLIHECFLCKKGFIFDELMLVRLTLNDGENNKKLLCIKCASGGFSEEMWLKWQG